MDGGGNETTMKIITIALMLFFLNLSVVMLDELGIYQVSIAAEDKWRENVEATELEQFDPDVGVDAAVSFGFGDFFSGFKQFASMVGRAVRVDTTLKMLGIDDTIANMFRLAVTIVYIIGVAQFISNTGTKGMQ